MLSFKDVPAWYRERLRKMYRKNTNKILACPDLNKINHLGPGCARCRAIPMYLKEESTLLWDNRIYVIKDDAYDRFCLRRFQQRGVALLTSMEFPTPKITSQHITRIPQFFENHTGVIYDCYKSHKEVAEQSSPYYINRARKVCSEQGLSYCQVLINKKEFTTLLLPELGELDTLVHKLISVSRRPPF